MQRRTFFTLAGALLAGYAGRSWLRASRAEAATWSRAQAWPPNANVLFEWRCIAGRITTADDDYGFIVSLSRPAPPTGRTPELLVMRKDATGAFSSATYPGTLAYDAGTATYTFQASGGEASATARYDGQSYRLSLSSPALTLADAVLRPRGDIIPEGGDGLIDVGQLLGFRLESDYYADWAAVELGGQAVGVARVDMQGLRPKSLTPAPLGDYDHHWFALAGTQNTPSGPRPVWVSAWRIVSGGTYWSVTIAAGASGQAFSYTETSGALAPLAVAETAWQPVPALGNAPVRMTGAAWHVTAGSNVPGDLIDLRLAVPPGQFAGGGRAFPDGTVAFLEEGVGFSASGTVLGFPLSDVRLVVAESTAEFAVGFVPLARG
jgi:hypothetical protein